MPANSWISTLERRIAAAAEPRTPEEIKPGPAIPTPAVGAEEVAKMVASEVSAQMESLFGRLEALVKPADTTPTAPVAPAAAPSAPTSVTAAPAAPAAAESPQTA